MTITGRPTSTWDRLDELLARYDAAFTVDVASATAWAGQLRVTLTDPPHGPSRSITFYAAGAPSASVVAARCLDDFVNWLADTDSPPMPVPDWMRA